jgi:hypothetical protein
LSSRLSTGIVAAPAERMAKAGPGSRLRRKWRIPVVKMAACTPEVFAAMLTRERVQ